MSLFKYSWGAAMINEFRGTPGGDAFLAQFALANTSVWSNFVALTLLFIGFRILALIAMAFVNTEKR